MSALKVRLLRCSGCGNELCGINWDTVFTCRGCSLGIVLDEEDKAFPIQFAKKDEGPKENVIYLPMWKLEGGMRVEGQGERKEKIDSGFKRIRHIYVAGFSMRKQQLYGDIGMTYTEANTTLEKENDPPIKSIVGITRGPRQAKRYADVILSLIVDKRIDITGMKISFLMERIELWAIPFREKEGRLRDCVMGLKFPLVWAEHLKEIKSCQSE